VLRVHDKLKFVGHRFQRVVRLDILCAADLEVNAKKGRGEKKGTQKAASQGGPEIFCFKLGRGDHVLKNTLQAIFTVGQ
jgi:hypothetical protein